MHIFRKTVVDENFGSSIITSNWQVVKIEKGTWLTAIARYGFGWPDEDLWQVYFFTFADQCEPTGDEITGEYKRKKFPEGGKWDGKSTQPGRRDYDLQPNTYWWFKIDEQVREEPEYDAEIKYLIGMGTNGLEIRRRFYNGLKQALWNPMQDTSADAKQKLLTKLSELEMHLKNTVKVEQDTDRLIEEHHKFGESLRKLLLKEVADARSRGEVVDPAEVDSIVAASDSWIEMFKLRKLQKQELEKLINWGIQKIRFMIEAHEKAWDPSGKYEYEIIKIFSPQEQQQWKQRVPHKAIVELKQ